MPPVYRVPWHHRLSFGALHGAMAVCHDWRRAAREDLRFHALHVRAPLRALHAAQGTADPVLPEIDLSSAQVCTPALHTRSAPVLCTPALYILCMPTPHPLCTCSAPAPRTRSAPLHTPDPHPRSSASVASYHPLRRPHGSPTLPCASASLRRGLGSRASRCTSCPRLRRAAWRRCVSCPSSKPSA